MPIPLEAKLLVEVIVSRKTACVAGSESRLSKTWAVQRRGCSEGSEPRNRTKSCLKNKDYECRSCGEEYYAEVVDLTMLIDDSETRLEGVRSLASWSRATDPRSSPKSRPRSNMSSRRTGIKDSNISDREETKNQKRVE